MEKFTRWLRWPKINNEKRAYFSSSKLVKELVRLKRRPAHLTNVWGFYVPKQKGWKWKSKKRKQWE